MRLSPRGVLRWGGRKLAPTAYTRLEWIERLNVDDESAVSAILRYEEEIHVLRRDLDEVRRDMRRVTELYDVVINRMQELQPLD